MALSALLGFSLGAAAQESAALLDCARISADAERLACFDRVVAAMEAAQPQPVSASSVVALHRDRQGALLLTLDNGQVWRQQDERLLAIDVGDKIDVVRASLGTFRITDKRGHSARFRRVH